MERNVIIAALLLLTMAMPVSAETDSGLWLDAGGSAKVTNRLNLNFGGEFRTRNNFKTVERFGVDVGASYKILDHLKASAGYVMLINNFKEKENTKKNKYMPSYYGLRHRFYVALQGDVDAGNFNFALRQKWQYTYRPESADRIYDEDDDEWSPRKGKAEHMLRTRLKVEYDINNCPVTPYLYGELYYNGKGMDKYRGFLGAEWKINKQHAIDFGALYQHYVSTSKYDTVDNFIAASISYKFKF